MILRYQDVCLFHSGWNLDQDVSAHLLDVLIWLPVRTTAITTVVYSGLRTFGGGENWVINLCRRLRDSPRSICSSASPNTLVPPLDPRHPPKFPKL